MLFFICITFFNKMIELSTYESGKKKLKHNQNVGGEEIRTS